MGDIHNITSGWILQKLQSMQLFSELAIVIPLLFIYILRHYINCIFYLHLYILCVFTWRLFIFEVTGVERGAEHILCKKIYIKELFARSYFVCEIRLFTCEFSFCYRIFTLIIFANYALFSLYILLLHMIQNVILKFVL